MPLRRLRLMLLPALVAGCISVPPDLRAELEPPDGKRPNNFGRLEATEVRPDRPTIAPVESRASR